MRAGGGEGGKGKGKGEYGGREQGHSGRRVRDAVVVYKWQKVLVGLLSRVKSSTAGGGGGGYGLGWGGREGGLNVRGRGVVETRHYVAGREGAGK